MMEAVSASEISDNFYATAWRKLPKRQVSYEKLLGEHFGINHYKIAPT
jgi:hypothetical protein